MKRAAVSDGVYEDTNGRFWMRPWIGGRRTWRQLHSLKLKFARVEAADLLSAHRRSISGDCRSPLARGTTFSQIGGFYLAAGCPNSLGEPRDDKFIALEKWRIDHLEQFYGGWPVDDIKLPSLMQYRDWRVKRVSRGTGARTTEMEWVTLSNIINFAVRQGLVSINYIRSARPRLRSNRPRASSTADRIQHCRQFAPADGNELNLLAEYFFAEERSQAIGFQMIFEAFTSCRSSEAQRLRMDAANPDAPGFIQGNHLFIARSKHGVNPFVLITDELADFLDCHKTWHRETHAEHPWWFPGRLSTRSVELKPLGKLSLNHALRRATSDLGLPKRTAHGLRSFYATRRRGEGASEAQIAAEMGISSINLLEQVYGGRPPNWDGQKIIRYWPDEAAPAWHRWKRTAEMRQATA
jgi:integrase